MFHPLAAAKMSSPPTDQQQLSPSAEPSTPRTPPPPTPAPAEAVPNADSDLDACTQNVLHDLVRQAAQRAWQARQRAQAEAQALQARNAFD